MLNAILLFFFIFIENKMTYNNEYNQDVRKYEKHQQNLHNHMKKQLNIITQ